MSSLAGLVPTPWETLVSARKTERLLNLLLCLLSTRRPLSVDRIHAAVPGYTDSGEVDSEAFRRMFERDKEQLRALGVPLDTVVDPIWDDEVGYRIARRDYELPDIALEPDEAAAVGLATRLWQTDALAGPGQRALLKLRAAGVDTEAPDNVPLASRVEAGEPAFAACLAAVRDQRAVTFDYRAASGGAEVTHRAVEPWGVVSWRGRWYLVGHDRDRGATRVFRLSRVVGEVRPSGAAGLVAAPAELDLVAEVAAAARPGDRGSARLRVRAGRAHDLRLEAGVKPAKAPGWDIVELAVDDEERLAERVAGYGPDVMVLSPEPLRAAVVRRLRAVLVAAP